MAQPKNNIALSFFIALFVFRYLRTVVSVFTWITFKPKPIAEKPKFETKDVTVAVPTTFRSPGELVKCLKAINRCLPADIVVVTSQANVELVRTCCMLNLRKRLKVLGVDKLNKRSQMLKALKEVETEIVVFADDDVIWPSHRYLDYLRAIFEDDKVGAGGTRQRVRRNKMNCWNFLGICYLERRVWNNVTTNAIDGSISTLSGRTAGYRTKILKTKEFMHYFTEDCWLVRSAAIIETTLEEDPKYIHQCIRWARAHWRGNFTVMTNETYWRSWRFWWGAYVIYLGPFQTPALLVDILQFVLLFKATKHWSGPQPAIALASLGMWILFTKLVKLTPHLCRHPEDLKFLLVSIIFSYLHGFINVFALFTLHVTAWGSQNLDQLKQARAKNEEVVPLLRHMVAEVEPYLEPTPGRMVEGNDYFSVRPVKETGRR